jgi:hypothetical protein
MRDLEQDEETDKAWEAAEDERTGKTDDQPNGPPDKTVPKGITGQILERDHNMHGEEIWVESRDEHGKPMIWYHRNRRGTRFRKVRKGVTILTSTLKGTRMSMAGNGRGHKARSEERREARRFSATI